MTTYALIFDTSTGAVLGPHVYGDSDVTLPANEIACTQAQATGNVSLWQVDLSTTPYSLVTSLAGAQAAQSALLRGGYANANAANISFTDAAGVTDTYQCDPASIDNLQNCLSGFRAAGAVPTSPIPFYWRSATNNNNPFTYADLENLSAAIAARGFANYNQLQTLIAKVKAAKKVSAVQAVVWINP